MRGVAIYMEGGGNLSNTIAELRRGMDEFLKPIKEKVRQKKWHWKLVACGGRDDAYSGFNSANRFESEKYHIVILLVDAEEQVSGAPHEHLKYRDGWEINKEHGDLIHLMAQTMETWIVSDHNTLSTFYGSGFVENALPQAHNLEEIPKKDVARALHLATHKTRKGSYHKIRHASVLLGKLKLEIVKDSCLHCKRLFTILEKSIFGKR